MTRSNNQVAQRARSKNRRGTLAAPAAVAIALALVAVVVSSCGTTRARAKEKSYAVAAVVLESPGRFDIRPQGADYWLPGAPGSVVFYGDTVRNGMGGGIILGLSAGGTLRAGEMSDFSVVKGPASLTTVDVERGEVWLDVPQGKTARVTTPAVKATSSRVGAKSGTCYFGVAVAPAGPTGPWAGTAITVAGVTVVGLSQALKTSVDSTAENTIEYFMKIPLDCWMKPFT